MEAAIANHQLYSLNTGYKTSFLYFKVALRILVQQKFWIQVNKD